MWSTDISQAPQFRASSANWKIGYPTAARNLIAILDQLQQAEALGCMETFAHRRLPCEAVGTFGRPAAAEQIQTEDISRARRPRVDGGKRDAHSGVPDMFLLVDSGEDFEAGIPFPAVFVMWAVEIDVKVDPLALRRDFEFLVALDIGEVGANEGFGDVPVPELVGFFVSVWVRFEM